MAKSRLGNVFIASCILFCFYIASMTVIGGVYPFMAAADGVAFALFILYFALYVVDYTGKAKINRRLLFVLAVAFISIVLIEEAFIFGIGLPYLQGLMLRGLVMYVLLFAIVVFLISIGQLARRHSNALFYIMLASAIAIIVVMLGGRIMIKGIIPNDEVFLCYKAFGALLSGKDPYAVSFAAQLMSGFLNGSTLNPTYTMNNGVVGVAGYPPLYLLSFAPYYLINHGVRGLSSYMILEITVFSSILLLVISWCFDISNHGAMVYGLAVILAFFVFMLLSPMVILLAAVLLLAYAKLDRWYGGILLGLAASIQQLSWMLVVLLILWSFRESKRAGIRNAAYAILTFAAISAYFIVLGAHSYIATVFYSVNGNLFPNSMSPIGFMIARFYGVGASSFTAVFYITALLSALVFVYLDVKELAGLFAMLPFAFLGHGQASYYLFFMAFELVCVYSFKKRSSKKPLPYGNLLPYAMALAVILMLSVIYASHIGYESNMGLHAFRYNLSASGNYITYNANFEVRGTANALYVYFTSYSPDNGTLIYLLPNATELHVIGGASSMSVKLPSGNSAYACTIFDANHSYACPTARLK